MPNYGRLTIEWDGPEPQVLMEVEMLDGSIGISHAVRFADLKQGVR